MCPGLGDRIWGGRLVAPGYRYVVGLNGGRRQQKVTTVLAILAAFGSAALLEAKDKVRKQALCVKASVHSAWQAIVLLRVLFAPFPDGTCARLADGTTQILLGPSRRLIRQAVLAKYAFEVIKGTSER